jgi:RNA-binding protein
MLYHRLRPPPSQTPPPQLLPPPSSFFSWFLGLKPLLISTATSTTTITSALSKPLLQTPLRKTTHFTKSLPPLFCHSFSTLTTSPSLSDDPSPSLQHQQEEKEEEDDDDDDEKEEEEEEIEECKGEVESGSQELEAGGKEGEGSRVMGVGSSSSSLPSLSVKEKKELASYAHSLGKKLKSQLVGKSGVTANVVSSFIETLESNELLKVSTFAINNFFFFYLYSGGLAGSLVIWVMTIGVWSLGFMLWKVFAS